MSAGKGTRPAIRGGLYAGKPYLTYAEHDRICRAAMQFGPSHTRKGNRESMADLLLDRRRQGAA